MESSSHKEESHLSENNLQFLEEVINYSSGGEDGFLSEHKAISRDALNKELEKEKEIRVEAQREGLSLRTEISQLKSQLIQKTNDISQMKQESLSLKHKYQSILPELAEAKDKNIELTYANIELQQKITALESTQTFSKQLHRKELSPPLDSNNTQQAELLLKAKELYLEKEKMFEIEFSRLANIIDELEINKSKLQFETKKLNLKLRNTEEDKQSEILLLASIKDNEIMNYKQTIESLNNQISTLTHKTQYENIDYINGNSSVNNRKANKHFVEQLSELNNRNKALDHQNLELSKQNQLFRDEIADCAIRIKSKDLTITKLQIDFDRRIADYEGKIKDLTQDVNNEISSDELLLDLDRVTQEKEKLIEENEELENGLIELNNNIKVAKDMFNLKYAEFESEVSNERYKSKEYKRRVEKLKLKINELHSKLSILKSIQEDDKTYLNETMYKGKAYFSKTNYSNGLSPQILSTPNSHASNCIISKQLIPSCVYLNDPVASRQKQSIEEYRRTLEKVDSNLKRSIFSLL